jgi:branched-chain amino acid transport system substrate-binding protein
VDQVRRLIEEDKVALLSNTLGVAFNSAISRYVNEKKVPHLFISSGADKRGDYQRFPWTMSFKRRHHLGPLRRRDYRRRN